MDTSKQYNLLESRSLKFVGGLLASLTALTPAFVIMGYYYEMGVLNAFGLNSDWINFSVERELLAFYQFLTHILKFEKEAPFAIHVALVVFLAISILSYTLSWAFGYVFRKAKNTRIIIRIKEFNIQKPGDGFFISVFILWLTVFVPVLTFYFLIIAVLPSKFAYNASYSFSMEPIRNFGSCSNYYSNGWFECVKYERSGDKQYEGLLIFNDSENIAIFTGTDTRVINKKTGDIIVRKFSKK